MAGGHWGATIRPLLDALRPRSIGTAGIDPKLEALISGAAEEMGYELVSGLSCVVDAVVAGSRVAADAASMRSLLVVVGREPTAEFAPPIGWPSRFVPGFGGLDAAAAPDALVAKPAFAAAWENLGASSHLSALCNELEGERAELECTLHVLEASHAELVAELATALDLLEEREGDMPIVEEAIRTATVEVQALLRRKRRLERRVASANAVAEATRKELVAERQWIAQKVAAVAASQSWRVGHQIVRVTRALTLRRDRGADGLTVILRRVGDGSDGPAGP